MFDGDRAVGWCQFGTPNELPRIYHRKQYEAEIVAVADHRITCLSSFLYNGTRGLFAHAGFVYERPEGKNNCVMTRHVRP